MKQKIYTSGGKIIVRTFNVHPNTKSFTVQQQATKTAMRFVMKKGILIKKWETTSHKSLKSGEYETVYTIKKLRKK